MSTWRLMVLGTACVALLGVPRAVAQPYDMGWFTIDCGGQASAAGELEVFGSVGQPDAGLLTGGGFELSGGYWTVIDAVACGSADFNCDGDVGTDGDIE